MFTNFMFATGIENSIPTINNGRTRIDEMEKCGHYKHWRKDFDCSQELGIRFCATARRCTRTFIGPGRYDWAFADLTFAELKRRNIIPIVDLCHFGVPDWIGNFQNPDFPSFSRLMPGLSPSAFRGSSSTRRSTRCSSAPCSRPHTAGGTSSCTTTRPSSRRSSTSSRPMCWRWSESSSVRPRRHLHPERIVRILPRRQPGRDQPAEILNARRFLSLDLNYGRRVDSEMYEFLMDNGMTRDEYHFFLSHSSLKHHCIMGNDYYVTNEHRVHADGHTRVGRRDVRL